MHNKINRRDLFVLKSSQVKSSLFIVTFKMHERTQRKTIQSPKSAEPKRYNINLNNYNKRYLQ